MKNVPSIATRDNQPSEQDRPINPHIFLGFRYAQLASDRSVRFADNDWALDSDDNNPIARVFKSKSTDLPYILNKFDLSPSTIGSVLYILINFIYTRIYIVE